MTARTVAHVPPVRSGNLLEETIERLLALIRLGQFPPSSRLPSERELAEALRVSRTTLRDALAELRGAGYLAVRRGRYGGTYVAEALPVADPAGLRPPDPDDVRDLLTFRQVVEPAATRLAAQRVGARGAGAASPADPVEAGLRDLREAHRAVDRAGPAQYRPLDARLHLTVAGLSGSPTLTAAVGEARSRLDALLDRIPLLPRNLEHSDRQHDLIVNAVLAGDPPAAERAAADHLAGTAALLRGFLA